VESGGGGRMEE
jgi:hypothetical protein